jgi:hypothetical protein
MRGKLVLTAVTLLVLGAGCGSDQTTKAVDPTTAPPAEPGGWLDDHSVWVADGAGGAGGAATAGRELAADSTGAAPPDVASPGKVAGPPIGSGDEVLVEPQPPVATVPPVEIGLRAGAVDDNAKWDDYVRYASTFEGLGIPFRRYDVSGRRIVTVHDRAGRPVLDATVSLVGADGKVVSMARTGADGQAIVFSATSGGDQQQAGPTLTVTKGDATASAPLTDLAPQVTLDLDEAVGRTKLDVELLLDATGSMGDEIERLKANMISVSERIAALPSKPDARFSLTVYRDHGDLFVTRSFDFTGDVPAFTKALGEVVAADGGDTPEDLESGLAAALGEPAWGSDDAVRLVFLVADAPPHLDYAGSTPYTASIDAARAKGVRITPIASSGLDDQGEYVFRQLAQATLGQFVFLTYGADGVSPGDSTTHHVDGYSAMALDDLVVQLVGDELAARA